MGTSSVSSSVSNSANSGVSNRSTRRTGATGAVRNNTTIINKQGTAGANGTTTTVRTQGDPGFQLGQDSDVIKTFRKYFGL